jgi:hypothetical protein
MKYIKSLLLTVAISFSLASCDYSDFGDINSNPNYPSTAYTSMLFTMSGTYVRNFISNSISYDPWVQEWAGYISESKNNQYGPLQTTVSFATSNYYLYAIKNLNKIISLNQDASTNTTSAVLSFGSNENQIAASKTLRAFFYMTMTDILGPIAYSEAFQGDSLSNWTPKYDSQEAIYKSLDEELKSAYSQFDESSSLTDADIFYDGDITKWKKFNATLRMMMAIKMADVDPTNGKARFADAYADGGMTDVEDGFNYTYDNYTDANNSDYHSSFMYYTGNQSYAAAGLNFVPNKVIVDALKEYNDPRMFVYFTLDGYKGSRSGDANDVNSYEGVPFGLASNAAVTAASANCCSVNYSYCEPDATYGVITTARALLVEAEAAELGWISASAETLYKAGIKASFDFSGASGYDTYIASDKVALSSTKDTALKQIVMQRFLAGFLTDGIEAWSDWRRYNIPTIPIYGGQSAEGITVYPYRMQYITEEKDYNEVNTTEIINTYFNGSDDRWQRVWWDTKDNI